MRSNRRAQLNEYWKEPRAEIRRARVRSEWKLVAPEVFLKSPMLLRQVKGWINKWFISRKMHLFRKTRKDVTNCVLAEHAGLFRFGRWGAGP